MKVKKNYLLFIWSVVILCNAVTLCWHIKAQDISLFAEISCGELIDKITILQIKLEHITDPEKRVHVLAELASLEKLYHTTIIQTTSLEELTQELKLINLTLWNIEDAIREKERAQEFDNEFIHLARKVYITNDQRSLIKKKINLLLESRIIEEKSYQNY